jgi:hypothetical protein
MQLGHEIGDALGFRDVVEHEGNLDVVDEGRK